MADLRGFAETLWDFPNSLLPMCLPIAIQRGRPYGKRTVKIGGTGDAPR